MKKLIILIGFSIVLQAEFIRDDTVQIVRDLTTSLYWQDNENISKTWVESIDYCESLVLGEYEDWRLPNINELNSLVENEKYSPSINSIFKKITTTTAYFSSTTSASDGRYVWTVDFQYGFQGGWYSKSSSYHVRCVRAGQ